MTDDTVHRWVIYLNNSGRVLGLVLGPYRKAMQATFKFLQHLDHGETLVVRRGP